MRIGDHLLGQRKLRQSELDKVAAQQGTSGKRLVSLLIAGGLIDFDDGSRALGEQKGVACALARHLENRDPALAKLLPAELGRAACALPIGRTSAGALIVCVRDPAPALLARLQQSLQGDILMVITPATRLENLVQSAYGPAPSDEFDIDFGSALDLKPAPRPAAPPPAAPPPAVSPSPRPTPPAFQRAKTPPPMPPSPDVDLLDPDSVRLALSDLDDVRVAKDPSQSGQLAVQLKQRATLPSPTPPTLEATRKALERAVSRDEATDMAHAFITGKWTSGLIVAIRDNAAIGYRGHGLQLRGKVEALSLSLDAPSTIQQAVRTRRTSIQAPTSEVQDQLDHAMRRPSSIAAAPVLVGGQAVAVIVAGDPVDGISAIASGLDDLERLSSALAQAYQRILRG